ncbi:MULTISPECIES: hypothetical protein [Bacillus cereus group]|jgi:putative aminopeptidase FrvX|uniref:Uncharacterized protein n=2 Tax=Bacillus cereus group TaxID=86661 RepID=A0A7D8D0M3_9BACI|nr:MULTISPECIES: hypothetical protein [Bacillus cereus group]ANT40283.1 hypothetical protein [Bacillus phage PfNC7401]ANT40353.1 hypothetical protein [Bacillus phage PfIS075]EJP82544.1 hypothetical protein IAU_05760 [Bacillus cereus IS075]EOO82164.1 hypothetical protein IGS_05927 [Bacillus cereus IS845/00]EOO95284.1 hypothetical protein IGQ_04043 [Bacillus cereus IS195]KFL86165.1 putative phage protein [Bacillus cereus]MRA63930.1 hypothetical protein [Bacillus thuringiensis]OUB92888.1 hypot
MRNGQLSFEDVIGTFDYAATSTSEKFLHSNNHNAITPTYEVHFYDQDEKQKIDWFESKSEEAANSDAKAKHGRIHIIKTVVSARTLTEIMNLD